MTFEPALALADRYLDGHVVGRIWQRDLSVWKAALGGEEARSISTRLGWLDVPRTMAPQLNRLDRFATGVMKDGIDTVFLLGMGGSSLCAEVMKRVCGIGKGRPTLVVLDTTDELAITTAAGRMTPERTLFVVSSKSGGTVEVASLEQFFWSRLAPSLAERTGQHFVAITDPGTALQRLAESRGYRDVFLNPADIGGRFSALSLFGLVPAALIGASPGDLLAAGSAMAEGCQQENHENAGLELGAFIGSNALDGRDKLTVVLPPSLAALGLWIEQLIAESTGKHNKGALPVVDEPLGDPSEYGDDRAFVAISTDRDQPDARQLSALEAAGHPVLQLSTRIADLGAEFFRWEFATAVAGAALAINPFDEPNVSEAKDKTKQLLARFKEAGALPEPAAAASSPALKVYGASASGDSPASVLRGLLSSIRPHDYVAFLSYLPMGSAVESAIVGIRKALRARYRVASTYGVGPRYLHSTGQYHKGGPNTAVAIVITADDLTQTDIPGSGYSFSVLKRAQALGDTQTLEAHGRRTLQLHVANPADAPRVVAAVFAEALT